MKNNRKSSKTNHKKQQQATTQTPDSGRSMVEMLGVLAVVGVLSIAGIMGYSYAMKKYQANKIAAELNLISTQIDLIMNQPHENEFDLSLGNPYDSGVLTFGNYAFSYGCGEISTMKEPCLVDENMYYLCLTNIPYDICSTLVQTTQFLPNMIEQQVNGEIDTVGTNCLESGNALALLFERQQEDVTDVTTEDIVTTTAPVEELDGYFMGSDQRDNSGLKKYSCSDPYEFINSTEFECSKCDNTPYKRVIGYRSRCQRCDTTISDSKDNANQIRINCTKCGRGVDWSYPSENRCAPGSNDIYPNNCENGYFRGLAYDQDLQMTVYKCYSCSDPNYYINATETDCSKCDNTSYKRGIGFEGRCQLCEHLSDTKDFPNKIKESCSKCGRGVDWTNDWGNVCAPGLDDIYPEDYEEDTGWGSCGENKFQHRYSLTCYDCSDPAEKIATETECTRCDNSSYKRTSINDRCYSCDTELIYDEKVSPNRIRMACAKCGRGVDFSDPNINKCALGANDIYPEDYEEESIWGKCGIGKFADKSGNCHSCSDSSFVENVTENECNFCDNSLYRRVHSSIDRCYRCDATEISDHKDQIRSICNKCNRGIDWLQKEYYLDNHYSCAPRINDVNLPMKPVVTEFNSNITTTVISTTPMVITTAITTN